MAKATAILSALVPIAGVALAPFTGGASLLIAGGISAAQAGVSMALAPKIT